MPDSVYRKVSELINGNKTIFVAEPTFDNSFNKDFLINNTKP